MDIILKTETQIKEILARYDNPAEAKAIWDEYLPDIYRLRSYDTALGILQGYKTIAGLEKQLEKVLTSREPRRRF